MVGAGLENIWELLQRQYFSPCTTHTEVSVFLLSFLIRPDMADSPCLCLYEGNSDKEKKECLFPHYSDT